VLRGGVEERGGCERDVSGMCRDGSARGGCAGR
jgi:hypothetical protein